MRAILADGGMTADGESSETELVERSRDDPQAFAELYGRYHDRVFRYLLTYAPTVEDAADVAQHVFLRALEALPSYRERGTPFAAWLFRIARNAATDAYRRKRRALPWDHLAENVQPLSLDDVEGEVVRGEDLNQMRILIARLDARDQELLALRFASDLTTIEISQVVGRSHEAVRKELQRTIRRLKEGFRDLEM